MIPIPAIDLKGGKVVRLLHGDFSKEKIYEGKPGDIARAFEDAGAKRLHVVDLDGAIYGEPKNLELVKEILAAVRIPVEIGGGLRTLEAAERYIRAGASYVIFGTKAALDTAFAREAARALRDKAIVGIDAKNGYVATDGWVNVTKTRAMDMAGQLRAAGIKSVIYTDIGRDGALEGPNFDAVARLCDAVQMNVIASGGISSLDDLRQLSALKRSNLTGVIIGKALYEKKFTVKEAVETCLRNE